MPCNLSCRAELKKEVKPDEPGYLKTTVVLNPTAQSVKNFHLCTVSVYRCIA